MKISDLCIRRPVFATVLSLSILLVGLVSYTRLPVREYPKIDEPVVTVDTTYRGASAEIVESQISKPLEDSLAGIEGVDVITSISRQENSQISVRFKLERHPDSAASDVRDRVSRVRNKLPADIDEPVIAKVEADANPIIWIAFSSDQHSALEVTDFANRIVKPRLQTLPGAADVRVFGERKFAMRIWLDRDRLAAFNLMPQDVEDALRRQNVEVPAGRIESRSREFSVVARTDLGEAAQFAEIIVKQATDARGSYPVRIADLGRVEIGAASERSSVRFKGRPAVALGVIKQATANPLELSRALRGELPKVIGELPPGMTANIAYDSSVFIDRSIDAVFKTIGEAMLLVLLIIFIFLRNFRATLIPLVTIPVSLIGAFALMLVLGFTINTLTLLALVLAIGLVVDDAIVVLENIYRHMEAGMPRRKAAFQGAQEIGFAVVAMTITLAAVYAPVAFMTGRTGKLFVEFALTLAGAVLVSGFVALTLSPMMCSRLLKHEARHGKAYVAVENLLEALTRAYRRVLTAALAQRWLVMLAFVLVAGANVFLLGTLKSELAPIEDRGIIIGVFLGPEGATLDYTDKYARQIEDLYAHTADVERYFVVAGNPTVSQGISFVGLTDWQERKRNSAAVVKELFPKFSGIPGVLAFPVLPPSLGQSPRERPINFVIVTSASYVELDKITARLLDEVAKNPGLTNVDTDLKLNKPELSVIVNRDKSMDTGVQIETVGRTLETMLGGRQVTRFKREGEQYDVIVQVANADRATPSDIGDLFVRARDGSMIPLANLLIVDETVSPRELNHFGQRRAVTLTANLTPGYAMGEALRFLDSTAGRLLPAGYAIDYAGQSREFKLSSSSLALTFLLALAFIYLVLAAQFESFRDPFIIMLTVPLSMTGALLALLLSGGTLNVYSQIGLVTLVGLITKHGILIVEFANQLQAQGRGVRQAVIEASELRLRPILMTTGAMVLGAIPLAIGSGAGTESRQQIGWVIVGGLLLGTFLTLFVVPTVYTLLARRQAGARAVSRAAGELG
ncbi:MAG: efflux RND transporter permease subunit [Candidatus Accumulibacter sp.]|uniref:efflux RND transporter permease subunit n=1 Tax=Accumulibacter sp. TaxID=2053492 RepID=UPI001ACB7B7D|nr:efflux RND transporter permease subunit [Accumulibacter sp.]MBN8517357.1 efflux RND transporter permease subunit [Accumulibacter sp.]MBO3710759.1 efflux RND transporter permease subunit [Accumulibacter sp.]